MFWPKPSWLTKLSPLIRQPETDAQGEELCRLIIEVPHWVNSVASLVESYQGRIHHELRLIPSLAVEVPRASLEELARFRHVRKIWLDAPVHTLLDVAVPTVGAAAAQEAGYTGKGVTVAVIDTGIFPHPDFTKPDNRILAWNDLVNQRTSPYDDNGHGTHVAGIIAGNGTASRGKYRGMAPETRLVGVKAMDKDGSGSTSTVISAIEWCLNNSSSLNIKIINLSLGSTAQESYRTDPLCRATSAAWGQGVVVCSAAGNEGPDTGSIDTPGINPTLITVGNFDDQSTIGFADDRLSDSSGRGPTRDNIAKPDLVAPGTNITSAWPNGSYRTLTGTSMATPIVAGAVAQIIQKWPNYKPDQIKRLLMNNARSMGLGPDLEGAGALNLANIFNSSKKTSISSPLGSTNNFRQIVSFQLLKSLMDFTKLNSGAIKEKRDQYLEKFLIELIENPR